MKLLVFQRIPLFVGFATMVWLLQTAAYNVYQMDCGMAKFQAACKVIFFEIAILKSKLSALLAEKETADENWAICLGSLIFIIIMVVSTLIVVIIICNRSTKRKNKGRQKKIERLELDASDQNKLRKREVGGTLILSKYFAQLCNYQSTLFRWTNCSGLRKTSTALKFTDAKILFSHTYFICYVDNATRYSHWYSEFFFVRKQRTARGTTRPQRLKH